jgi:type I restriction enzyme M protein
MLLHGIVSAEIKVGDTLGDPQFTTRAMLDTFEYCVANPPFSQKNWMPSNGESDLTTVEPNLCLLPSA